MCICQAVIDYYIILYHILHHSRRVPRPRALLDGRLPRAAGWRDMWTWTWTWTWTYIYIYMHMYIYMYVYIHLRMYIYIYIYTYIHIYTHVCMFVLFSYIIVCGTPYVNIHVFSTPEVLYIQYVRIILH